MSTPAPTTALVTGASGGIGGAVAARLAGDGWSVVCHRHRGTGRSEPASATWVTGDLSTTAGLDAVSDGARRIAAGNGLGLLVHCAGRLPDSCADPWQDGLDMFALHALALSRLSLALCDVLEAAAGTVVLLSSSSARRATTGQAVYGATKAAAECLVRHLGQELGRRGVRVVGVRPSLVDTPMSAAVFAQPDLVDGYARTSPFGRTAQPADIAGLVLALSSPDARWLTGRTVWADGGTTLGWCDELA